MPDPLIDDAGGIPPCQFNVSARPQVLPEFRPLLHAGLGEFVHGVQLAGYFGEQRRVSDATGGVVGRLVRAGPQTVLIPEHIGPGELQNLARAAERAVPGEHHHQPPLSIRARVEDAGDAAVVNELVGVGVALGRLRQARERIRRHQILRDRGVEELRAEPRRRVRGVHPETGAVRLVGQEKKHQKIG